MNNPTLYRIRRRFYYNRNNLIIKNNLSSQYYPIKYTISALILSVPAVIYAKNQVECLKEQHLQYPELSWSPALTVSIIDT